MNHLEKSKLVKLIQNSPLFPANSLSDRDRSMLGPCSFLNMCMAKICYNLYSPWNSEMESDFLNFSFIISPSFDIRYSDHVQKILII